LSEAYCRLIASNGSQEETDTEAGLTADGLMSAIRRVLNSISGKFPALYPQLEAILEQPILLSLSEAG
jgi:2-polyprenyl-6-methoxyphenol hydroxylase-like FAD-dependent oxidoreductase|tara:strand:+ start:1899 stop:2102 length:204 start_codon:yes stop_codon:yes gene_type:complete